MTLQEEIHYRSQMLSGAVEKILSSNDDSFEFYYDIICKLGIYDDGRLIYGDNNKYINPLSGLWQEPFQFAMLLSFLAKQNLTSYCEIGPFQYWSFALISAVLNKNNDLKSFAVDKMFPITMYVHEIFKKYDMKYDFIIGTSENIKNNKYDLVFIDADHSYNGVKSDWENVGQFSK